MQLKILIADDEQEARELILHYLQDANDNELIETADGTSTLRALQNFQPDILFLDIKMPELSGIEVLQQREDSALPALIFTTAYDEYALPAFDYDAVDYLLKPFEKERFQKAYNRAIDYVLWVKNKKTINYRENIAVKSGSKIDLVAVGSIEYFQAEGAYVEVCSENKIWLIADPVYELEATLNPSHFIRVHRSIIVNIHCIKSIQSLLNGDHFLLLKSGKKIRASRTYRENIKKIVKK